MTIFSGAWFVFLVTISSIWARLHLLIRCIHHNIRRISSQTDNGFRKPFDAINVSTATSCSESCVICSICAIASFFSSSLIFALSMMPGAFFVLRTHLFSGNFCLRYGIFRLTAGQNSSPVSPPLRNHCSQSLRLSPDLLPRYPKVPDWRFRHSPLLPHLLLLRTGALNSSDILRSPIITPAL